MEMNVRLQVEHGVSEMLSGIDIVREQILIAAGEPLSVEQKDIKLNGHVIECRINAEDPDNHFLPCPGKITGYAAPGGFGVRIDSHVYPDYQIPPYYDSLISKLICWAPTRQQAIRRTYRALKEYVITGVKTTLPFYMDLIENPVFLKGDFDTGFLEKYLEEKKK